MTVCLFTSSVSCWLWIKPHKISMNISESVWYLLIFGTEDVSTMKLCFLWFVNLQCGQLPPTPTPPCLVSRRMVQMITACVLAVTAPTVGRRDTGSVDQICCHIIKGISKLWFVPGNEKDYIRGSNSCRSTRLSASFFIRKHVLILVCFVLIQPINHEGRKPNQKDISLSMLCRCYSSPTRGVFMLQKRER